MATDPHERVRSLHCSSRQGKRPAPELRQSPAAGTVQALTQHWPHWLYTTFETDVACADGTAQPFSLPSLPVMATEREARRASQASAVPHTHATLKSSAEPQRVQRKRNGRNQSRLLSRLLLIVIRPALEAKKKKSKIN